VCLCGCGCGCGYVLSPLYHLQANLASTAQQLETERAQNAERKKKVRAFLDNLSQENKTLQESHAAMAQQSKDALAAKAYIEQHRNQLESALHSAKEQAARELEARAKEWLQLENGYHSQLSEKDAEIRHLLLQVELASQSNVEEVTATRALIQESMREMEAHKAKRLAARSEMINLAKVKHAALLLFFFFLFPFL
jgi:chromosome segregation ATPase